MGISESNDSQSCQAIKENSPTSGLLRFLVARGEIDRGLGYLTQPLLLLSFWQPHHSFVLPDYRE